MMDSIESHIDVDAIEMLKEIMEDDFVLLINTFLSDAVDRLSEISEAVQTQVADDIRRAAHSFKGSSANIGAFKLQASCLKLEDAGTKNTLDDVPSFVDEIKAEFEAVSKILNEQYLV